MKKYATRMAKDDFDLQLAANRVRDLRASGTARADARAFAFGDESAADGPGGAALPAAGAGGGRGGGKGGRNGRARRLKADGSADAG